MAYDFTAFVVFWQQEMERVVDAIQADILKLVPSYLAVPAEQLRASIHLKNRLWQDLLLSGNIDPVLDRTRVLIRERSSVSVPVFDIIRTSEIFLDHVIRLLAESLHADLVPVMALQQIEAWWRLDRDLTFSIYNQELETIRLELQERELLFAQQADLVRELSTPIVPITDAVLVLPLVGQIDMRRATQMMELALERIVADQADVLILDLTGVPIVDDEVANYLMQLAKAVHMIGAQIVLVGIRAATAQSMVALGVDLSTMMVRATLKDAIFDVIGSHPSAP